jgi:hypothetical protein
MAIIGVLPVTLVNGTVADATQVMSDLNFIVSQANANGAALAGGNAFTGPANALTYNGDVIATLLATQTFSNKTLTSPIINGGTIASPTLTGTMSAGGATIASPTITTPSISTPSFSGTVNVNSGYTLNPANNGIYIGTSGSFPAIGFVYSAGGVDSKIWDQFTSGSTMSFRIINDASNVAVDWLQVVRVGNAITGVTFSTPNFTITGGSASVVVLGDGRMYGTALHNNANPVTGAANQYIASGAYNATITNRVNTPTGAANGLFWMRVGNVVTVSGVVVSVTTTSAGGANSSIDLSLPIPSTLGGVGLGGSASGSQATVVEPCYVSSDPANNVAYIQWFSTSNAAHAISFTFSYLIS